LFVGLQIAVKLFNGVARTWQKLTDPDLGVAFLDDLN
jgi:hypothetical protein